MFFLWYHLMICYPTPKMKQRFAYVLCERQYKTMSRRKDYEKKRKIFSEINTEILA